MLKNILNKINFTFSLCMHKKILCCEKNLFDFENDILFSGPAKFFFNKTVANLIILCIIKLAT